MKPLKKIKCHHVDNNVGHPTPIDTKKHQQRKCCEQGCQHPFFWEHSWDLKNVLGKF